MYLRPFALPQCAPHVVMGYCLCQDRKSQEDKGMNDLYCPCWSLRLTRGAPLLIAFPSHPSTYSPTTTCTLTKQLGATTMTMYCDMHVHRTMLPLKTGMPAAQARFEEKNSLQRHNAVLQPPLECLWPACHCERH